MRGGGFLLLPAYFLARQKGGLCCCVLVGVPKDKEPKRAAIFWLELEGDCDSQTDTGQRLWEGCRQHQAVSESGSRGEGPRLVPNVCGLGKLATRAIPAKGHPARGQEVAVLFEGKPGRGSVRRRNSETGGAESPRPRDRLCRSAEWVRAAATWRVFQRDKDLGRTGESEN